ncbi:MAG TPA: hypothetical protein VH085_02850 [Nocardioides sp.]|nr:hypothetical protein [Nocardioides sp.]
MMRRTALAVLGAATMLVLAGCGGGSGSSTPTAGGSGSSPSSPTSSPGSSSSGPSGSPYPKAVQGVSLTAQGSKLGLGKTARVMWRPDQKTVGVAAISVTRLQRMPISTFSDWRLDAATRRSTPYFVHATVRNLGHSNLSGRPVPLYLLDQRNTLLQASSFQARFPACPSLTLPAKFTRGKKTSVCLVYFAPDHGKLVAMSFRPDQAFEAITWKGHLAAKHTHQTHKKHQHHKKHHKKK